MISYATSPIFGSATRLSCAFCDGPRASRKGRCTGQTCGTVGRVLNRLLRHAFKPRVPHSAPILHQQIAQLSRARPPRIGSAPSCNRRQARSSPAPKAVYGCRKNDPCCRDVYRRYVDQRPHRQGEPSTAATCQPSSAGGGRLSIYLRQCQGNRRDSIAGTAALIEADQIYSTPMASSTLSAHESAFAVPSLYV